MSLLRAFLLVLLVLVGCDNPGAPAERKPRPPTQPPSPTLVIGSLPSVSTLNRSDTVRLQTTSAEDCTAQIIGATGYGSFGSVPDRISKISFREWLVSWGSSMHPKGTKRGLRFLCTGPGGWVEDSVFITSMVSPKLIVDSISHTVLCNYGSYNLVFYSDSASFVSYNLAADQKSVGDHEGTELALNNGPFLRGMFRSPKEVGIGYALRGGPPGKNKIMVRTAGPGGGVDSVFLEVRACVQQ